MDWSKPSFLTESAKGKLELAGDEREDGDEAGGEGRGGRGRTLTFSGDGSCGCPRRLVLRLFGIDGSC